MKVIQKGGAGIVFCVLLFVVYCTLLHYFYCVSARRTLLQHREVGRRLYCLLSTHVLEGVDEICIGLDLHPSK